MIEFLLVASFIALIGGAVLWSSLPGGFTAAVSRDWSIGPVLRKRRSLGGLLGFGGTSWSVGMPRRMKGGSFDFPVGWPAGHVHYVTRRTGPLNGKARIRLRFRIEAAPSVDFITNTGTAFGSITLYFQRAGDDWLGGHKTEAHRWYATFATLLLDPGDHEIVAPLDGEWTAVHTSSRSLNPMAFRAALAAAESIGFVFGGGDGFGHGVCADGPARFVLIDFAVEG